MKVGYMHMHNFVKKGDALIRSLSVIKMKTWKNNSILNNQTEETPPKEIFQAVCDEIGNYFETKNFKYSKSTPKITLKDNQYKLEIRFNSSASNYAGGYVNLEINSNLYSIQLAKTDKTNSKFKGLLTGVITPLSKSLPSKFKNASKIVEKIDGEIIQHPTDKFKYKEYIFNRNINIYQISHSLFEQIIKFIEIRIIKWYDEFKTDEGLVKLLSEMGGSAKYSIDKENFYKYLEIRDIENIDELKEKIKDR
ncbi:hypothetical protein [Jiulongibacter sp. NS-SX5]|uniref:hypothetical protein n=1 Tax=Jiulongibacter sp. NS-SX5 TaxID=3463854 RepID=UPI004058FCEA